MSGLEDAGEPELNAAAIVEALNRHQVRYVIIGTFAAIAQQAPIPATETSISHRRQARRTCARLSLALDELGARIPTEGVPGGLAFSHDATSLAAAEMWNLICPTASSTSRSTHRISPGATLSSRSTRTAFAWAKWTLSSPTSPT